MPDTSRQQDYDAAVGRVIALARDLEQALRKITPDRPTDASLSDLLYLHKGKFSDLRAVKRARDIRNQIAHESPVPLPDLLEVQDALDKAIADIAGSDAETTPKFAPNPTRSRPTAVPPESPGIDLETDAAFCPPKSHSSWPSATANSYSYQPTTAPAGRRRPFWRIALVGLAGICLSVYYFSDEISRSISISAPITRNTDVAPARPQPPTPFTASRVESGWTLTLQKTAGNSWFMLPFQIQANDKVRFQSSQPFGLSWTSSVDGRMAQADTAFALCGPPLRSCGDPTFFTTKLGTGLLVSLPSMSLLYIPPEYSYPVVINASYESRGFYVSIGRCHACAWNDWQHDILQDLSLGGFHAATGVWSVATGFEERIPTDWTMEVFVGPYQSREEARVALHPIAELLRPLPEKYDTPDHSAFSMEAEDQVADPDSIQVALFEVWITPKGE